jgi:hypothetical protein
MGDHQLAAGRAHVVTQALGLHQRVHEAGDCAQVLRGHVGDDGVDRVVQVKDHPTSRNHPSIRQMAGEAKHASAELAVGNAEARLNLEKGNLVLARATAS